MRRLLLLRHAATEPARPGHHDRDRRLTPDGEREAAGVGEHLRGEGTPPDVVLCSPATRARQTAAALGLDAPVVVSDRLYDAGARDIVDVLRSLGDDVERVLVVGHAPGLPAVARDLADPDRSDADALAAIEWRFPTATLASLEVAGPWAALRSAALLAVRVP